MKKFLSLALLSAVLMSTFAHANRILPVRSFSEKMMLSTPAPAAAQKVVYYGGPVIANVKVMAVFWGSSIDATIQKQIGGFYSTTTDSTYFDWLKEYNTGSKAVDGRAGTNQSIGRGSYIGSVTITPSIAKTSINDTDIQAELDLQIAKGVLPKADSNTLYMIYFPGGVSITIDNQTSCTAFCAYHNGFASKTHGNVFYGVMPDMTSGACAFGCGFAAAFDNVTEVSSHELIEAVTDPFPTPGSNPTFPQAWNTTDGNEVGDLCAGNATQLTSKGLSYNLQQEYDNTISGCTSGPFQSP